MKTLRNVIVWLLLAATGAISLVGVMATFPTTWGPLARIQATGLAIVGAWKGGPNQSVNGLFWLFLTLLLLTLLVVLMSVLVSTGRTRIEVQMADGRVVIMDTAIKKYIRTALGELSGITTKQIVLKQSRAGLRVDVYAQVRSHEKLPELEARIISRVKEALTSQMGITAISAVHVYIRDFRVLSLPPAPGPEMPNRAAAPVSAAAQPAFEEIVPARAEPVILSPTRRESDVISFSTPPTPDAPDAGLLAPPAPAGDLSAPSSDLDLPALPEKPGDPPPARRGFFSRWQGRRAAAAPQPEADVFVPPADEPNDITQPAADTESAPAKNTQES